MTRIRLSAILIVGLLSACAGDNKDTVAVPSRHLYVWMGTSGEPADRLDMMTVVNADASSPSYGVVQSALTVDSAAGMPHHTEFFATPGTALFANDYFSDKTYLIDFSVPEAPHLVARVAAVPGGRRLHSFARLANGHVIATVQFSTDSTKGDPGGLAEFDAKGAFVRAGWSRDSAFPGALIRTYALTLLPAADRVVTTSAPMSGGLTADVVQIWRLSDLTLLKTLSVPIVPGDSAHRRPFEVRTLADGSVMLNTYRCGLYRITALAGDPKIERVLRLPDTNGCAVPVIVGHFMVMPIAYGHRYASIDIGDPAHPREVASLPTDSTFFPHWASLDPGSDRIAVTDQGDGAPMLKIVLIDRATGQLRWDPNFKDRGATAPGVSYDRDSWPNGAKGMAMPHAAVFVP